MEKKIFRENDVYYKIEWSRIFKYDRISATRILPELSGILCIMHRIKREFVPILFFACWREGCRVGIKKLLDDLMCKHPHLRDEIIKEDVYYRYTIVDTKAKDMHDIMFWLMKEYKPELNDHENYEDSQRYKNIHINEEFNV